MSTVYCKSFEVEKFRVYRNKLQFAGKHSRLHGDLVWPNPIAQAISLEEFCDYRSIREDCETFPPRTICNIRYMNFYEFMATSSQLLENFLNGKIFDKYPNAHLFPLSQFVTRHEKIGLMYT